MTGHNDDHDDHDDQPCSGTGTHPAHTEAIYRADGECESVCSHCGIVTSFSFNAAGRLVADWHPGEVTT